MNLRITLVVAAAALFPGCSESGPAKFKGELIAADKALCARSVRDGPKAAMLAYVIDSSKVLSEFKTGADGVNALFMQYPPGATLTWDPAFVDVSASGDLGYTWGRYTLRVPVPMKGGAPLVRMGNYVTVWRRQLGGGWKVVLNGNNPDGRH